MAYDKTHDPSATTGAIASSTTAARKARSWAKSKTVTPSDTTDLTAYAGGLIVLVGGNLKVIPAQNADADTITFTAVTAGQVIPIQTRRVFATGTTATVATLDL